MMPAQGAGSSHGQEGLDKNAGNAPAIPFPRPTVLAHSHIRISHLLS